MPKSRSLGLAKLRFLEDGGVAIEFAIISTVLVLVCLGALEFGRAIQLRNELASVADRAARQILTDSAVSNADIEATIRQRFQGDPSLLQVRLETETIDGAQFRTLLISYPVTLLIPQLSNRSIALQVERRTLVT